MSPRRSIRPGRPDRAVRLGTRSAAVLIVASLAGLLMFVWPLLVRVDETGTRPAVEAPFVFVLLIPVLIAVVLAELSEGGLDSRALAMLGVLSAVNAALRPLGAGLAGLETVFFLLILAGRVFGPAFGFVLGCTSLFASALLTAGVGPWLPYQMLCAAWIGMLAGLLPRRVSGKAEIAMLVGVGIVVAYGFGFLMNLAFWPYLAGVELAQAEGGLAFVPGAPPGENLHRFVTYTVLTTTLGWDTGRAILNTLAILVLGPAILATLRRVSRRSSFEREVTFASETR